jgi:nicotinate phosphoribosyltransferase
MLSSMPTSADRSALLTDLYQLTMAYGYWKAGRHEEEAVFHLFFRRAPFGGSYAMASGLAEVVGFLEEFSYSVEDLAYLRSLTGNDGQALFEEAFLTYLGELTFSGSLHAMPEGTLAFGQEPLLRYQGPLLLGQLLETPLLTLINFPTLVATKAARVCQAAQGDAVLEFGLRRAQGVNGGLTASRAAYLGGCSGTSNVLAGQRYGIPVKGTHAHSWVMSYEEELASFEAYARAMPNNCIFLVDTYDTLQGVRHAIEVGQRLQAEGHRMVGIRLDSGDLRGLSIQARRLMDQAGLTEAAIVASNDLDEYEIARLKAAGARIDLWGVGTRLATAKDDPALGGVYKLAALRGEGRDWNFRLKLSDDPIKVSNPGLLQIQRYEREGEWIGDLICHEPWPMEEERFPSFHGASVSLEGATAQPLLQPIFEAGKRTCALPPLAESRQLAQDQLAKLSERYRRLEEAASYPVGLEPRLAQRKQEMMRAKR